MGKRDAWFTAAALSSLYLPSLTAGNKVSNIPSPDSALDSPSSRPDVAMDPHGTSGENSPPRSFRVFLLFFFIFAVCLAVSVALLDHFAFVRATIRFSSVSDRSSIDI